MQTAQELFLHELSDMLDAEHRILEVLAEQAEESSNSNLQNAFQSHREQTEAQILRLKQCFETIGEEIEQTECSGMKGLLDEHESIMDEDPSPDILDIFNLSAGIKVERYEISAYESLIRLAEVMEQTKIVRLLNQSLKEEEQTLKKLIALAPKLKPETVNSEELEDFESEPEAYAGEEEPQEERPGPRIVKRNGSHRGRVA